MFASRAGSKSEGKSQLFWGILLVVLFGAVIGTAAAVLLVGGHQPAPRPGPAPIAAAAAPVTTPAVALPEPVGGLGITQAQVEHYYGPAIGWQWEPVQGYAGPERVAYSGKLPWMTLRTRGPAGALTQMEVEAIVDTAIDSRDNQSVKLGLLAIVAAAPAKLEAGQLGTWMDHQLDSWRDNPGERTYELERNGRLTRLRISPKKDLICFTATVYGPD